LAQMRRNKQDADKVALGMHVAVELIMESETERLEFDIVSDKDADFAKGFLGVGTPLAKAILGQPGNTTVPYQVDEIKSVRIVEVSLSRTKPPKDTQSRREEVIRKAVERSDRTNAVIFASSFSGKWGDYDPTGFTDEEDKP